jgi:EAL domain-containing protein (putative c-di-GMP-specific phosphodiesterase class I)
MTSTSDPRDASPTDWPMPAPEGFDLEQALRNNQVEYWYQPKIDLVKKRLAGLEAFARLSNADGSIVNGAELIANASPRALVALSERALITALQTSANLHEIGVDVRLAINVTVATLTRLPIAEIVQKYRPRKGREVNIVFDVAEKNVLEEIEKMKKVSKELREAGFSIAIDDFGAALISIAQRDEAYDRIGQTFAAISQLGNVRFSEMKIDRTLVRRVSESEDRQKVCSHIVSMAHSCGAAAVAVGVETQTDLQTLMALGCDIGQGYLFGRPMTEDELLMTLWDRSVRAKEKQQASDERPTPALLHNARERLRSA